jgi:molecular chaperone GrpE
VDNLDRALSTVPPEMLAGPPPEASSAEDGGGDANKDLRDLVDGLKITERVLMQTLEKHGLTRFDPSEKGEKFDPNLHEATFMTRVEGKEDGTAFSTVQKGFMLNGRVIRVRPLGVAPRSEMWRKKRKASVAAC